MAAMEGGDGAAATAAVDSKDLQQQSKALDKLTDRVEDRQLDSSRVQSVSPVALPCSYFCRYYIFSPLTLPECSFSTGI